MRLRAISEIGGVKMYITIKFFERKNLEAQINRIKRMLDNGNSLKKIKEVIEE